MKRYALLVGVKDYANSRIPLLDYAHDDANELKKVFRGSYEFLTRVVRAVWGLGLDRADVRTSAERFLQDPEGLSRFLKVCCG